MRSSLSPEWPDTSRPAVILGSTASGLGVARSLAPFGVECWICYNDRGDPALKSRFGRNYELRDVTAQGIAEALATIRERTGKRAVLFPTSDSFVEAWADGEDILREFVAGESPSPGVLRDCMSKTRLDGLFDRAGLDYPRTVIFDDASNAAALADLRFPCILKPGIKTDAYTRKFPKAWLTSSPEETVARFREIREATPMAVVQEYLAGPATEIFFCLAVTDPEGTILRRFVGRKLASWPPGTGSTAACIPAPEEEERLSSLTERFFKTSGFYGIGSLEFKRDPQSGRFLAIEPTVARVDFQSEVAVLNGVNLPLAYYCVQTGQPPPPVLERRPVGWKDSVALSRLRHAHPRERATKMAQVRLVDSIWRANDPGPWLEMQRQRMLRAPRAVLRRLGVSDSRRQG